MSSATPVPEAEPPPKRRFRLRWWHWTALSVTLVVLSAVVAGWLLFSSERSFPLEPLQPGDQELMLTELGLMMQTAPGSELRREFSPEQLAALQRAIDHYGSLAGTFHPTAGEIWNEGAKVYRFALNGAVLELEYLFDTQHPWLFGGVLPIRLGLRLQMERGEVVPELVSCRIGAFPVPTGLLRKHLAEAVRRCRELPEYEWFRGLVRELYTEPGKLVVVYDPEAVRTLLFSSLNPQLTPGR